MTNTSRLQRKSLLSDGVWEMVYRELGPIHISKELRAQLKVEFFPTQQVGDIDRSLGILIQTYCPKPETWDLDFLLVHER
jgi:hypothetical protein